MKCPKCQTENRDGVKFCEECGTRMEIECPGCGAKIPLGNKLGECGRKIDQTAAPPFLDYDQPRSYTLKFMADKILTTRASIEGEHKLVTVLFADVADFTGISEKLGPEQVIQIMDGCFKILMDEIHKYEGTINQFTGDGRPFWAPFSLSKTMLREPVMPRWPSSGPWGHMPKKSCSKTASIFKCA